MKAQVKYVVIKTDWVTVPKECEFYLIKDEHEYTPEEWKIVNKNIGLIILEHNGIEANYVDNILCYNLED